jgi:pimeloyl-ACP methyl ester carboxylesterase
LIRFLRGLLAVAVLVYLILLAALYAEQLSLIFHRSSGRPMLADRALESRRGIVCLTTAEGLDLRAWYFAPTHRGAPVILFLHGNAGDIGDHLSVVAPLITRVDGVLALEYRGYGGNPGEPSESGLYADAKAALDFLRRQKDRSRTHRALRRIPRYRHRG